MNGTVYVSSINRYKSLLHLIKKNYFREIHGLLEHARDAATFWKTIDSFKEISCIQENISKSEWYQHYYGLRSSKSLEVKEMGNYCLELSYEISMTEIITEISHLANNKASGIDGILNEAILDSGLSPYHSLRHPLLLFNSWERHAISTIWIIACKVGFLPFYPYILSIRLVNGIIRLIIEELNSLSLLPRSYIYFKSLIHITLRQNRRKYYAFFVDLRCDFYTVASGFAMEETG
ncbi:hypothetical protein LAZ67_5002065 [Cordylochernes scorpioides]|uniref:Maturase K n=1 Tax=Cordylochernes scorpioides TaxID=51811 RepID=A0ABY6KIZ7_9ARAC|nr:hypothetical protein LAZ67_5002065 [Cordylochernes scorpioides]